MGCFPCFDSRMGEEEEEELYYGKGGARGGGNGGGALSAAAAAASSSSGVGGGGWEGTSTAAPRVEKISAGAFRACVRASGRAVCESVAAAPPPHPIRVGRIGSARARSWLDTLMLC